MQGETTKQNGKGTLSHYKGKLEMSGCGGDYSKSVQSVVVLTVTSQRQVTLLAFSKA